MLKLCLACRGAKEVNGLGSMNMVPCRTCKGIGKVEEEFDFELPCTHVPEEPENLGLGSENPYGESEKVTAIDIVNKDLKEILDPKKSVSKSIKEVLTNGKKKK